MTIDVDENKLTFVDEKKLTAWFSVLLVIVDEKKRSLLFFIDKIFVDEMRLHLKEFEESLNKYLKPYLENALQTGWLIGKKAMYPDSTEYRIILRDL